MKHVKLVIILSALVVFFIVGNYSLQRHVILPEFLSLENIEAKKDYDRVKDALSRELEYLTKFVSDWSAWDDTYQFIFDKNRGYIDSNMDWKTLGHDSNIGLIYLYSKEGEVVWGEGYLPDKSEKRKFRDVF